MSDDDFNHFSGYSKEEFSEEERQKIRHLLARRRPLILLSQGYRTWNVFVNTVKYLAAAGAAVAALYGMMKAAGL